MGMGMGAVGAASQGMQQPTEPSSYHPNFAQPLPAQPVTATPPETSAAAVTSQPGKQPAEDPTTRLLNLKKLLDVGVISQEEFDRAKSDYLGF